MSNRALIDKSLSSRALCKELPQDSAPYIKRSESDNDGSLSGDPPSTLENLLIAKKELIMKIMVLM